MSNPDTSVVLFYSKENGGMDSIQKSLQSLENQNGSDLEIFLLNISNEQISSNTFNDIISNPVQVINCEIETLGAQLNKAFKTASFVPTI